MEQRQPLLSDERLKGYKGEATIIKLLNNPGMSSHEVRSFYENLITKGKLIVPKQARWNKRDSDPFCMDCGYISAGYRMPQYTFCPGCGGRITE